MPERGTLGETGIRFTDGETAAESVDRFLGTLDRTPDLLGFGEPTHGVEAFPDLRNHIVEHLVRNRGYRSIALESGCPAGAIADAYITRGEGTLDEALEKGFSHEFGSLPSNRRLLAWLREFNADRDPADRVRFYGFDGPMEMMSAPSPRASLMGAHRYLVRHLGERRVRHDARRVDALLGDDAAWSNPAAMMDPAQSVGDGEEARALRPVADDLLALLEAEAPGLREESSDAGYEHAHMLARTALGLLRYHAAMASSGPDRFADLCGLRDAMMAENLEAVAEAEAGRGPCLAFAHNAHLQRRRSSMVMGGERMHWWGAGALVAQKLKGRYVFIASDMAEAEGRDAAEGDPDSLQGVLSRAVAAGASRAREGALFPAAGMAQAGWDGRVLQARSDLKDPRYIPLDGIAGTDAVVFIRGWATERALWGEGVDDADAETSPRSS
ncbi:erythromycin esterase family protein [Nocardiopsis halophila]|uniref:erythromycin esterase family protein n=1 Tax=Nocardiopsis halophila TaxID=141692 RepID=UPI001F4C5CCE|nr:erythromycin esterase family protein [Nocardiopsis halophila]